MYFWKLNLYVLDLLTLSFTGKGFQLIAFGFMQRYKVST